MNPIQERFLNYIMSQSWAIDLEYGLQQFDRFMFESEQNSDVLKDTLLERRKSLAPKILNSTSELDFNESILTKDVQPGSVLKLTLSGVMTVEDQLCSNNGIRRMTNQLYDAYQNKNIIGVAIETSTGGGESLAGDMLNAAISDKNKPVIQYIHQSGSAAVRGTLNANERWASSKSATIGSIGTYFSMQKGFAEWYKENYHDMYAEGSPNKNKAFRDYINGDTSGLQKMVNIAGKMFQTQVKETLNLKGDENKINDTLSGGMFYAQDAKQRGLVDGIGTMNRVIERIKSYY